MFIAHGGIFHRRARLLAYRVRADRILPAPSHRAAPGPTAHPGANTLLRPFPARGNANDLDILVRCPVTTLRTLACRPLVVYPACTGLIPLDRNCSSAWSTSTPELVPGQFSLIKSLSSYSTSFSVPSSVLHVLSCEQQQRMT